MRVLLSRALVLALLLWPAARASRAQGVFEEVYVPTSTSILYEPVSYVVPTRSVYVVPTSRVYTTTSYVAAATSYTPTAYVYRRGLFGPKLTATVYSPTTYTVPTSYVVPTSRVLTLTSLDLPVVSSASACCDDAPVATTVVSGGDACCDSGVVTSAPADRVVEDAPLSPPASSPAKSAAPANGSGEAEPRLNPNVLRSEPANRTSEPAPPAGAGGAANPAPLQEPAPANPAPVNPEPLNPPSNANAPKDAAAPAEPAPATLPAPVNPNDLPAPAAPSDLPGAAPANPERREVQRPAFQDPAVKLTRLARSTLQGRVLSIDTAKPEPGVAITIADARERFRDRTVTTDAAGNFSVVLPEGDWNVRVPKAKGAGTIDLPLTVGGGLITDDRNQEVTRLTINR